MTNTHKLATAGALLVISAATLGVLAWRGRSTAAPPTRSSGLTATLSVEAFSTSTPAPRAWTAAAFADSLSSRLAKLPGLTLQPTGGNFSASDFIIRGEATARDERLVLAVHLHRRGEREAVWTATFWRSDTLTSELVSNLSGAITEAIYGQVARSAVTTAEQQP